MRTGTKRLVVSIMAVTVAFSGMPVCVSAASVGKVKSVTTKAAKGTYLGYVSSDKPPRKMKYQYGYRASWKKVSGATGYEIYTYGYATKKWKKLKTTKKTKYVFTDLFEKSKIKYKVRAFKEVSGTKTYGAWSKAKTATAKKELAKRNKNGTQKQNFTDRYSAEKAFAKQNEYRKAAGSKELIWSEAIYDICLERAFTGLPSYLTI